MNLCKISMRFVKFQCEQKTLFAFIGVPISSSFQLGDKVTRSMESKKLLTFLGIPIPILFDSAFFNGEMNGPEVFYS